MEAIWYMVVNDPMVQIMFGGCLVLLVIMAYFTWFFWGKIDYELHKVETDKQSSNSDELYIIHKHYHDYLPIQ